MIEIGASEAKNRLPSLLEKVRQGEEVLITNEGKAVAKLVPAEQTTRLQTAAAISKLLSLRKGIKLNGLDWKALRDEGRR